MQRKVADICDERMLMAPKILKADGKVKLMQEVWDTIGIARQNLPNIKRGHQRFTKEHIFILCEKYKVNANWIMGFEENFYREEVNPERSLEKNQK